MYKLFIYNFQKKTFFNEAIFKGTTQISTNTSFAVTDFMIFTVKYICSVQRKTLHHCLSLQDMFNIVNTISKKVLQRSFNTLRHNKNKFSS